MIVNHPWFGPKNGFGWGWTPVSWEGWVVIAIFLAVILGAMLFLRERSEILYVSAGAVMLLLGVILLTGTAPG
jgi:hypothetical protein